LEFEDNGKLTARYNVEATRFQGSWRAIGNGNVELVLQGGTYTAEINGEELKVSDVTLNRRKLGSIDPAAKVRQDALVVKRGSRATNVSQYKRELAAYESRMTNYRVQLSAHRSLVESFKDFQYVASPNQTTFERP
ncbi:MAG: hypothetical protein RIS70_4012, partial [Planctomycetota bacterium]